MNEGTIAVPKEFRANAAWRMKALWDGGHSAAARKAFMDKCREDILFWLNTFVWTYDPRKKQTWIPFTSYPFQDECITRLVSDIRDGRDVGIMKSRDMGASWMILAVFTWLWLFAEADNAVSLLLVSRNEDYVDARGDPKSLFWKVDKILEHLPPWMLPGKTNRTMGHLENCDTGSVIDGESTTGDVGRGDRRTAIMMDEFAAFETKDGYNAMASTQSATRCRIFNSTPKGSANAFYDVIHKSAADILRMHWSVHPEKRRGLYTSERDPETGRMNLVLKDPDFRGVVEVRVKGDAKVRRVAFPEDYPFVLDGRLRSPWYDLECSRAVTSTEIGQELDIDFLGSDYQFFDPIAVAHYEDEICVNPVAVGDAEYDPESCRVTRFVASEKGFLSLWELPDSMNQWAADDRFVMGVDVSAGTGASNSTITVYRRATKEKVAEYANPNVLPDDFGRLVTSYARWFNDARIVPDRSGPTGEVLVRRILAQGYTNIYVRRRTNKFGAPQTDEPGVFLNPSARTAALQQYRDAISHASIRNRSARAMEECLRFICKMDGNIEHSASANARDPSGARANHGDIVIADCLANLELMENADGREDVKQEEETPYGSLKWRMEEFHRREKDKTRDTLEEGWEI